MVVAMVGGHAADEEAATEVALAAMMAAVVEAPVEGVAAMMVAEWRVAMAEASMEAWMVVALQKDQGCQVWDLTM